MPNTINIKRMQELTNPSAPPAQQVKETFYPVTHEKAVRDDNGTTLESKLQDIEANTQAAIDAGIADMEDLVENSALRYDEAQTLTDAQKAQALANVGISGIDSTPTAGSQNLVTSGGVGKVLYGESFDATISIDITAGTDISTAASKRTLNLVSGRKYKVTFGGNRAGGTFVAMYLQSNNEDVQFKCANTEDAVDAAIAIASYTVQSSTTEVWIMPLQNVDSICFYTSGSNVKDTGTLTYRFEWKSSDASIVSRIEDLESADVEQQQQITALTTDIEDIESDVDALNANLYGSPIDKDIIWAQGWINVLGSVFPNSESVTGKFSQPFLLKKGEKVTVGTGNIGSICVIGTTNLDNLVIGNTVNVVEKTTSDTFSTFSHVAEQDEKITICVNPVEYTLSVSVAKPVAEEIERLESAVSDINDELNTIEGTLATLSDKTVETSNSISLDILKVVQLNVEVEQGHGIPLAGSKRGILVHKNTELDVSYVYDTGIYDGSESIYLYKNYTDGTESAGVQLNASEAVRILADKDIDSFAFYSPTSASANGKVTFTLLKSAEPEPEPEVDVPAYYFTNDYLQDKVDVIQSHILKCAGTGDIFAFTTDEHWERNAKQSVPLIKYISENINLYKWISGGDSGHLTANIELGRLRRDSFKGKVLPAIGNHEYLGYHNYTILGVENKAAYAYFMPNDGFIGNILRGYYYWNDVERKIRYIVLSAFQPIEGADGVVGSWGYEQEQLNWFTNTALAGIEEGWNIIIITHSIAGYYTGGGESVLSYNMPPVARPFGEAMLRYSGNGSIVAVFEGHSHVDGITAIDDYAADISQNKTGKVIPVIVTTCDAYDFDDIPGEALENRELGTITEQAFDINVIDFSEKKIDCVRIGATANLTMQKSGTLQERIVNYEKRNVAVGNTISLSSGLAGTVSWTSQITSVATVDSNGVVTGMSEGTSLVSAIDSTNHVSSTFIVKVTSE